MIRPACWKHSCLYANMNNLAALKAQVKRVPPWPLHCCCTATAIKQLACTHPQLACQASRPLAAGSCRAAGWGGWLALLLVIGELMIAEKGSVSANSKPVAGKAVARSMLWGLPTCSCDSRHCSLNLGLNRCNVVEHSHPFLQSADQVGQVACLSCCEGLQGLNWCMKASAPA